MSHKNRSMQLPIVAALAAGMFTMAAAQAVITLTGDDRFMSAAASQTRPDGGGSGSGPFTKTPLFGEDQYGNVVGAVYRDGCQIVAQAFQDSMVRSDLVKASGFFQAQASGPSGFSGTATVINRVEYRFTLADGEFWNIQGTTSGAAFFELYDPTGALVISNSGSIGGAAMTSGSYRLLTGLKGSATANLPGGPELIEGNFNVRFELVPTPGTAALAGVLGLLTAGKRRRA